MLLKHSAVVTAWILTNPRHLICEAIFSGVFSDAGAAATDDVRREDDVVPREHQRAETLRTNTCIAFDRSLVQGHGGGIQILKRGFRSVCRVSDRTERRLWAILSGDLSDRPLLGLPLAAPWTGQCLVRDSLIQAASVDGQIANMVKRSSIA